MKQVQLWLWPISMFVLTILMPAAARTQSPDHLLLDSLLTDFVDNGTVDYAALCKDARLEAYLGELAAANPDSLETPQARLAFWINAYNVYTLKIICDHYPLRSINDLHLGGLFIGTLLGETIWDQPLAIINGQPYTLNQIEHEIIRKQFDDPRVHFALVCASKSCSPLRSEAFRPEKLDEQLEDQGRVFFSQIDKNRLDPANKEVHISRILKWYRDDFGPDWPAVLRYISRFFAEREAGLLRNHADQWTIRFTRYDWTLNDKSARASQ